ncbi:MAG: hypothetical protein HY815_27735 [Candidatus Riflebacteria bacterium]|nr:hypothetical protein [Candidatus Riflebacteria bacterium]
MRSRGGGVLRIAAMAVLGTTLVWFGCFYLPLRWEREAVRDLVARGRAALLASDFVRLGAILEDPLEIPGERQTVKLRKAQIEKEWRGFFRHARITEIVVLKETTDVEVGAVRCRVKLRVRLRVDDSTLHVEAPQLFSGTLELARQGTDSPWKIRAASFGKASLTGDEDEG